MTPFTKKVAFHLCLSHDFGNYNLLLLWELFSIYAEALDISKSGYFSLILQETMFEPVTSNLKGHASTSWANEVFCNTFLSLRFIGNYDVKCHTINSLNWVIQVALSLVLILCLCGIYGWETMNCDVCFLQWTIYLCLDFDNVLYSLIWCGQGQFSMSRIVNFAPKVSKLIVYDLVVQVMDSFSNPVLL